MGAEYNLTIEAAHHRIRRSQLLKRAGERDGRWREEEPSRSEVLPPRDDGGRSLGSESQI